MSTLGVLALQGGFRAHSQMLRSLGHEVIEVRKPKDLEALEGLVLPGGESSTQLKMLDYMEMREPLLRSLRSGLPVLATCAGLILLAKKVTNPAQDSLNVLDLHVARNAWGRQLDSFEATADQSGFPLVFIRAPRIQSTGQKIQVLETYQGEAVMVQQGNIYAATFHPEWTEDASIHIQIFGTASAPNQAAQAA